MNAGTGQVEDGLNWTGLAAFVTSLSMLVTAVGGVLIYLVRPTRRDGDRRDIPPAYHDPTDGTISTLDLLQKQLDVLRAQEDERRRKRQGRAEIWRKVAT